MVDNEKRVFWNIAHAVAQFVRLDGDFEIALPLTVAIDFHIDVHKFIQRDNFREDRRIIRQLAQRVRKRGK